MLILEKDVKGSMDRKTPQVGIEHRLAEKASLSCVGTCQRSHWSRRKERDPHKTKADKPFRLLLPMIPYHSILLQYLRYRPPKCESVFIPKTSTYLECVPQ